MCSADCEGPTALDVQRDIIHSCISKNLEGKIAGSSISSQYSGESRSSYTPVATSKYGVSSVSNYN